MKNFVAISVLAGVCFLATISQSQGIPLETEISSDVDLDEYVRIFSPHRAAIKTWFDRLFSDQDPPRAPRADYLTCDVCKLGYPLIKGLLAIGASAETIIDRIVRLCISLGIESEELCEPTVNSYGKPVIYIIENRPDLTANDLCGVINPGCSPVNETLTNWDIELDERKPPILALPPLPERLDTTKILQLTDVHLDVNYTVGMNADCGMPLCCREANGLPENDTEGNAAGPFGHYKCALPPLALESILEHAKETHPSIKYVFLTGDYVHSGIWLYSQEENGRNIDAVTEAVANAFPDTPVYPLTGNHEPDIVNMYPPEELWGEFDLSWMYQAVSRRFTKWLGPSQLATFKKGGYYSVSPEPGLRLVVVNTNLCYINNFWLAYDTHDPTGQLQWMADTMLEAERDGENVYIVGHIMPGSGSCWPYWSDKFDRIVNRFENIIRGQFYGHSHTENFALTFERGTERPLSTSILWTCPSAVTDGMNSGYKIYHADGERGSNSTWEIVDTETHILNTTRSNQADWPVFEKLFSSREAFNLTSLRGDVLYDLVVSMITDDELYVKFERHHTKGMTTRGHCDPNEEDFQDCKMGLLCDCVISYSGDESHCDRLHEIQNGTASV